MRPHHQMDDEARQQAFLTALVTEHFVLQSTRGTISSEATGRAALYLGALSSALIALGFATTKSDIFGPFIAAVLPVIFILGVFTFVRLFQIGLEDVQHLQAMQRIRRFYASLSPDGSYYFLDLSDEEDEVRDVQSYASLSVRVSHQLLLTAATAVAVINSMVAAVGIAVAASALGLDIALSALIGGIAAIVLVVLHLRYQIRRARLAA